VQDLKAEEGIVIANCLCVFCVHVCCVVVVVVIRRPSLA
jgi:hypothetical protein